MLISNYFKSSWRNLIKNKLFSVINVFGLAIGLAACVLITLYVRDELGFDEFWSKADNIYRTHTTFDLPGRDPMLAAVTPGPVMAAMQKDFPEIEMAARISLQGPTVIRDGESFIDYVSVADPDIINIFDFEIVAGDLAASIADTSSIALSEELAKKYFGEADPINKILTITFFGNTKDYKVAAIYKDLPTNSQVMIPALVGIDEDLWTNVEFVFHSWFSVNAQLFFTLPDGYDIAQMNKAFPTFVENNYPAIPIGGPDAKVSEMVKFEAMNVKDLHLKGYGFSEYRDRGSMETVETFSAIALLILIIAAINFMNLSTANASQRAREVSLRKVVGASRGDLIIQFLGESMLITLFALLSAMVMVEMMLPIFNDFVGKELTLDYMSGDLFLVFGLAMVAGFLGAVYPAFVLSSFRPAVVLKANKSVNSKASTMLRTGLVIFQFGISIGLFVSTGVIYAQMQYAASMDVGFTRDNILIVERIGRNGASDKEMMLLEELRRHPQVVEVTNSSEVPGRSNENNTILRTPDMPIGEGVLIGQRRVGYGFFETFEVPLMSGRFFDRERNDERPSTDSVREGKAGTGSLVVNESALGRLGLGSPKEALGKIVLLGVSDPSEFLEAKMEIVGVIPDIHLDSLRSAVRPEVFMLFEEGHNFLSARFKGDPEPLVEHMRSLWDANVIGVPFSHSFVSENMANLYQAEENEALMFAGFSLLAIIVASLGLFGLASFSAERRTREIGVRKVMGASVWNVVRLLVWQFSLPVLIANLIAWPIAFWQMDKWLERFVYRIGAAEIIILCAFGGLAALMIAWGTVAGNSYRVARSNPIHALRSE